MHITDAVRSLDRDLHDILGTRLESLVAYAGQTPGERLTRTLAIVRELSAADLRACAAKITAWREAGLATPLLVAANEFERSLDAFPFEFGAILADHTVVSGGNPFNGLRVSPDDLRRACEVQARGLLLHLREGFIETEGRSDRLVDLLQRSAAALGPLIANVVHLFGDGTGNPAAAAAAVERRLGLANTGLVEIVSFTEGSPLSAHVARRIFPTYLEALERLASTIDTWSAA